MRKDKVISNARENILPDFRLNRRSFLKLTGSGIFIFFVCGDMSIFSQEEGPERFLARMPGDFNAYLKIGEDGQVTCFTGKIEMGQEGFLCPGYGPGNKSRRSKDTDGGMYYNGTRIRPEGGYPF